MTLLFGLLTAFITELVKKVKARYGEALGTLMIYGVIFLIALIWTLLTTYQIISPETIDKFLTIVASAVATYELIIKRLSVLFPSAGADKK